MASAVCRRRVGRACEQSRQCNLIQLHHGRQMDFVGTSKIKKIYRYRKNLAVCELLCFPPHSAVRTYARARCRSQSTFWFADMLS